VPLPTTPEKPDNHEEDRAMKAFTIAMGAVAALAAAAVMADAAEIGARCDYRTGSRERTKISVDAKDLRGGTYTVTLNGTYAATATVRPPDDEIEADFDSDRANVRRGATEIPKHMGAAGSVVIEVSGVAATTLSCPGQTTVVVP
jgi:hypothetical protein